MSTKAQREKEKRKQRKQKKQQLKTEFKIKKEEIKVKQEQERAEPENEIEVEYVVANPFENEDDANEYEEFKDVFGRFVLENGQGEGDPAKIEQGVTNGKIEGSNEPVKEEKLSKKKKKLARRLPIAVLKSMVERPDLVEPHDTCAANPFMLMHLKAHRNTVPVPRHWSQKRKYLQGKRGIEKSSYELPDFIKKTGIMDIRNASLEKDASKALKAKAREKLNPTLGKIDIDYQVLHDAFFKWQTKPKFSSFGDVYYESKEYEVELKEKRPGTISPKLKEALGLVDGAPPPWLHNMQRMGPPPSYPGLRIPGFNAALPPGASYGFHPGGWGKPPMDDQGRPLFQESVSTNGEEPIRYADYQHWGAMQAEEPSEDEVQQPAEGSGEESEGMQEDYNPAFVEEEKADTTGTETPLSGLETPTNIEGQLRKRKKDLYEVLEEQQAHVSSRDIYGSTHKYIMGDRKHRVDGKSDGIELSIDPTELETLTEDALKKRLSDQLQAEKKHRTIEDDDAEDGNKRKRGKEKPEKPKKKKKTTDYKF